MWPNDQDSDSYMDRILSPSAFNGTRNQVEEQVVAVEQSLKVTVRLLRVQYEVTSDNLVHLRLDFDQITD